jgi:hypothetical protein
MTKMNESGVWWLGRVQSPHPVMPALAVCQALCSAPCISFLPALPSTVSVWAILLFTEPLEELEPLWLTEALGWVTHGRKGTSVSSVASQALCWPPLHLQSYWILKNKTFGRYCHPVLTNEETGQCGGLCWIPALWRLRQEDYEFKINLGYKAKQAKNEETG